MRSDDREHIDWYDYGFIREDSLGRVYYRISEANSEGLIYSNSTQKGDTLIVARRENDIYLSFYEFTVDSIDTILISGKSRKRNLLNGGVEQWIEGIGSLSGPIYSWPGTVGGDGYFLLCFKQNDSLIYMKPSYSDCYDILNSENSINQHKAIQIYPNPVVDCNFNIEFQHLGDYKLSIYNAVSKLIKKYEVTNVQKLEIRDKIQKGLYFIHIYDYSLNREFKEKIIIL